MRVALGFRWVTSRTAIRRKGIGQKRRRQQEQAVQEAGSHDYTKHRGYLSRIAAALMRLQSETNIFIAQMSMPKSRWAVVSFATCGHPKS